MTRVERGANIRREPQRFDEARFVIDSVGIGQVVVVVDAEKHPVPARESRDAPCDIQTLRADAPSRAEHLRTGTHRIDFGVGVGLVDVDVIGGYVYATLVAFTF